MSAYLFGELFVNRSRAPEAKSRLVSVAEEVRAGVSLDGLDEGDQRSIEELAGPRRGVAFSFTTRPGSGDASGLWAEAQELAFRLLSRSGVMPSRITPWSFESIRWPPDYFERMSPCRLHRVLHSIALLPAYDRLCVTFTEGGIESVHRATAADCVQAILRMVVLPWDCTPGILHIWPGPAGSERDRLQEAMQEVRAG